MNPTASKNNQQSDKPFQYPSVPQLKLSKKFLTNKKSLLPAGIFVFLLIFIPILFLMLSKINTNKTQNAGSITPTPQDNTSQKADKHTAPSQQSNTLVYGTWIGQNSIIKAIDLDSSTTSIIATLPQTIKKITVLSNNTLLYIDETDANDNGQRISIYNTQQKQITTDIPAAIGFAIDDYLLSPNKRYMALWEVQFAPNGTTLQGGNSRVYVVDLTQPSILNLLYNETVTTTVPVHYPRAVLNNGTVLTDQYIPNDPNGGTGWAYGMSVVDFDGTNKQDITSMTNGTYGSQPSLSSDGKFLLFAGYDGSNGNGTTIKNGYRQAVLTPNTVELLDTGSMQRFKLPNLTDTNIYSDVQWDKISGNVILSMLSSNVNQMGVYSYDLGKLSLTKIQLPVENGTPYGYISQLSNNKTLIGMQNTNPSNLGNLGQTYAYAYSQIAEIDNSGNLTPISLLDPFIQYITILPSNYFNNVLGAQTESTPVPNVTYGVLQGTQNNNQQNEQLSSKPTLATIRLQEMSNSIGQTSALDCQNLGNAQCGALGLIQNSTAYNICQDVEKANNQTANACY
jgi:hypothetical protein